MSRSYQTLVRIALFAGLAAAWELFPRAGIVDAMLLPPLSDVLATLIKLLGQPNVHEALAVTARDQFPGDGQPREQRDPDVGLVRPRHR